MFIMSKINRNLSEVIDNSNTDTDTDTDTESVSTSKRPRKRDYQEKNLKTMENNILKQSDNVLYSFKSFNQIFYKYRQVSKAIIKLNRYYNRETNIGKLRELGRTLSRLNKFNNEIEATLKEFINRNDRFYEEMHDTVQNLDESVELLKDLLDYEPSKQPFVRDEDGYDYLECDRQAESSDEDEERVPDKRGFALAKTIKPGTPLPPFLVRPNILDTTILVPTDKLSPILSPCIATPVTSSATTQTTQTTSSDTTQAHSSPKMKQGNLDVEKVPKRDAKNIRLDFPTLDMRDVFSTNIPFSTEEISRQVHGLELDVVHLVLKYTDSTPKIMESLEKLDTSLVDSAVLTENTVDDQGSNYLCKFVKDNEFTILTLFGELNTLIHDLSVVLDVFQNIPLSQDLDNWAIINQFMEKLGQTYLKNVNYLIEQTYNQLIKLIVNVSKTCWNLRTSDSSHAIFIVNILKCYNENNDKLRLVWKSKDTISNMITVRQRFEEMIHDMVELRRRFEEMED